MADSPSRTEAADHTPGGSTTRPGMPRWVKAFGISAGSALLVAFVLMHAIGGGMSGH
ncbi:hypothetical protein ACF09G_03785 [Streptomyces albogriseolus]|uniref:Uncharacterized protein n=1 Tax=Streptomyces sp. FR1 TaxID=349971 RepID=V9Z2X1_9ACTN|nr:MULTISPECIES: hypothetical protein [unclassified Streptomyces]AHE38892.1 hypothetical protein pFRL3_115c [Streptomyces sp. FR1]